MAERIRGKDARNTCGWDGSGKQCGLRALDTEYATAEVTTSIAALYWEPESASFHRISSALEMRHMHLAAVIPARKTG
ncbi:MAG: hypothetical protein IPP88_18705 [Betaproteobacteria bacterium]|nr:hypothetical protein [Betaproteobacteria bacterium]